MIKQIITILFSLTLLLITACGGGSGPTATNTAPLAHDGITSLTKSATVSATLRATDIDGDALTYRIINAPTNGILILNDSHSGEYSYTHSGTGRIDSFTFVANDGTADSNTSTILVTIINSAPVASSAGVSLPPLDSVSGKLTATDIDDDPLSYRIVSNASNGILTLIDATTGDYTYTHLGGAIDDSFSFVASDAEVDSNIATVSITTTASDAPASGLSTINGDQRVTLNWDPATGADNYNIYWSNTTGTGMGGTKITGVTPPFYHDGLINGQNYYYVVTSVNAIGESSASAEISATPVDIRLIDLTIADNNLSTCVSLSGLTYVHELTSLSCRYKGVMELTGIEALTSLTALGLSGNLISDVTQLAGLTNLTYLGLASNNINNLLPLSRLTNLTNLDLYSNNVSNLTPLMDLTNLTQLSLTSNNISNLIPLAGMESLSTLSLENNSIVDLTPLAELTTLTKLYLSGNSISNLIPLDGLYLLTTLYLNDNNISNLTPLDRLFALDYLYLNGNSISDVTPLAMLTGLQGLSLNNNNISDVSSLTVLSQLRGLRLGNTSISDLSSIVLLTGLTSLDLRSTNISDVSSLSALTILEVLWVGDNIGISCSSLASLIAIRGSPPVDTDGVLTNNDSAIAGTNCTNP